LQLAHDARNVDVWRDRKTYPKFLPKEKIADSLEAYAVGQEIHIWTSSTIVLTPIYHGSAGRWCVEIDRAGTRAVLTPKHIVMAAGNGKARIPTCPGMESFLGPLYHSDNHKGAAPFKGRRVIVVDACNAGADICQDFVTKGAAEVTMAQRAATRVISSAAAEKGLFGTVFSERYTIEDADFINHSIPHAWTIKLAAGGDTQRLKDLDQKLHDDPTEVGFKLTWELTPGGGEVGFLGFFFEIFVRHSFGCCLEVTDHFLQVKQGVEVDKLGADGMVFKDGFKIEADVIVLAMGNESVIADVESIFGEEIKDKIGSKIWGLDEEGELTRCYRPTGAPGLWFAPGAFQHPRFVSKHLV
ncbi:hypothetical protein DFH09DRAFT_844140, partial [Mycena vulgaris]